MSLPPNYTLARLKNSDHLDALSVLSQLTTVGEVSIDQFKQFVNIQLPDNSNDAGYYTYVIRENDKLVAIATLLVEIKLIHGFSKVGHIEDVAVDSNQRGRGLGKILIEHLISQGLEKGCYKIILDCDVKNVGFYEKCGMKNAGIEMETRG
ncbi:glucosamine 6-phosphate N-acetyltransferase [Martiniozyma asiatica (nom. inval.)]|nr:glucosamine 6-phosphate N-acetyltransferase [Martiniozyma asiatica]